MRTTRILAATAATALAATGALTAAPSTATPTSAPTPQTIAKGLVSPLTLAVTDNGTTYVTQNFAGMLTKVGAEKALYQSKGGNEVGGVSERKGTIVFTETKGGADGEPVNSWVKVLRKHGKARTLANVRAYENRTNPDGAIAYGVQDITEECAAEWPVDLAGPPTWSGVTDSHPYATYQTKKTIYVADAGMNAILAISRSGRIRTVAVTPPSELQITEELAGSVGAPDCAGLTYHGESVPTDVEMGKGGKLYVTTEGGGLGEQMPLGGLYRIDPKTGGTKLLADDLFAPTGVAVAPRGDLYVAQLFGGVISKIKHGSSKVRTFASANLPAAVQWTPKGLYATIDVLVGPSEEDPTAAPGGRVVRFRK